MPRPCLAGSFSTPIAVRDDEVDDATQARRCRSGIDRRFRSELVDPVIRIVDEDAERLQIEDARRPDQLAQILDRVLARRRRELVSK